MHFPWPKSKLLSWDLKYTLNLLIHFANHPFFLLYTHRPRVWVQLRNRPQWSGILKYTSYDLPAAPYPTPSTASLPQSKDELVKIARTFITGLNSLLKCRDFSRISSLMVSTSYWRDHLGLSNTKFTTLFGAKEIVSFIEGSGNDCNITSFSMSEKNPQIANVDPAGSVKCLLVHITFQNTIGNGIGIMRLIQDVENRDEWRIYTMFTTLYNLTKTPFSTGAQKPYNATPDSARSMSWREYRERKQNFIREEPTVLIVGAGHSGLMIAARLTMLGVSNLIIDKQTRSGDSWRLRYDDLVLHGSGYSNAMPYLPYPPTWPLSAPKDNIADFLESYESTLDLNVWNQAQIVSSKWEAGIKCWKVEVERVQQGKKSRRTLCPRHVVQATGLNGEPLIPEIPGLDIFAGKTMHSSEFVNGSSNHKGKKVIVVGAGVSAHDICQVCYKAGAEVTMIQRSPVWVLSLSVAQKMNAARYNEHTSPEQVDVLSLSLPSTLFRTIGADAAAKLRPQDEPLIDALEAVGFRTVPPEDKPNLLNLTIQKAGGFYINIGASELIASGAISLKYGQEISHINKHSITFEDGDELEADEIIFATGYQNGRARTRKVFGDSVADKIDSIWGYNEMGEIRGVWRRAGHPAFWVAAGAFWISRYYS